MDRVPRELDCGDRRLQYSPGIGLVLHEVADDRRGVVAAAPRNHLIPFTPGVDMGPHMSSARV
jgi:hypothetical protein